MEEVMAMEGSFKNYRNHLAAASPPCVPYIGVYLTDLVFIEGKFALSVIICVINCMLRWKSGQNRKHGKLD